MLAADTIHEHGHCHRYNVSLFYLYLIVAIAHSYYVLVLGKSQGGFHMRSLIFWMKIQ